MSTVHWDSTKAVEMDIFNLKLSQAKPFHPNGPFFVMFFFSEIQFMTFKLPHTQGLVLHGYKA